MLGAVALVATLVLVPETRSSHAVRLDLPGALLSNAAVGGLVFGIIANEPATDDALDEADEATLAPPPVAAPARPNNGRQPVDYAGRALRGPHRTGGVE